MHLVKQKNTTGIISLLLILEGIAFLFCAAFAIHYHEKPVPFIIPFLVSTIFGIFTFYISTKKRNNTSSNRENVSLIIFIWFVVIIIGTLPFLLSKSISSYTDILFETISGFTSTGSTILPDPGTLSKSILLWRSLSQWYGGILTIIMLLLIFPEINLGGYEIFSLQENKLNLVFRVFIMYCALTFLQVLLLRAGGINLFKSMCISFGTISTGCFLPDKTAIAGYTPYIQSTMAAFMFLSGIGGVFYYKLSKLNLSISKRNDETRIYLISGVFIVIIFFWIIHFQYNHKFGEILRESIFQTASFLSSSGYEISGYSSWPHYFQPLIYLLIFIGGTTNSASGGIKMSRFLILFRNIKRQFENPVSDSNISEIIFNNKKIGEKINLKILTFITIFGVILVFGTLVLSVITNDLKKSVFLTITALSTFGHNISLSGLPQAGKIVLSLLMLIGRLEIFPLLVLFIPSFYKNTPARSKNLK
ncbi:MAG: TrkH family potassium uptake protein [Prolixibacteraceae bacterium]|nr:TrkH family potassium uptake protein [Prolixibacteraceae bacterium]